MTQSNKCLVLSTIDVVYDCCSSSARSEFFGFCDPGNDGRPLLVHRGETTLQNILK